jgi:hypothetical protein
MSLAFFFAAHDTTSAGGGVGGASSAARASASHVRHAAPSTVMTAASMSSADGWSAPSTPIWRNAATALAPRRKGTTMVSPGADAGAGSGVGDGVGDGAATPVSSDIGDASVWRRFFRQRRVRSAALDGLGLRRRGIGDF